jgi:inorganic pyrophosphatase
MEDEEGKDSKIIAVPDKKIDSNYSKFDEIDQIDKGVLEKIKHFFEHYKELEKDKFVKVVNWETKNRAQEIVTQGIKRFKEEYDRD